MGNLCCLCGEATLQAGPDCPVCKTPNLEPVSIAAVQAVWMAHKTYIQRGYDKAVRDLGSPG